MIISHKYKFIFIKTRKTAGTSIESYLSQYCGNKDILTPVYPPVEIHKPRNSNGFNNHMLASNVREIVGSEIWDNYYKFCVERNPWDKTLSYYHMINFRNNEKLSLDDYFSSADFCIDYPAYTEPHNASNIIVDRVIQYDSLNDELKFIFDKLKMPFNGDLGIYAKSEYRKDKRFYKDVLSAEQAKIISNAFTNEISLFNYSY